MQEKIEGFYGHTERRRREFAKCLMAAVLDEFKSSDEGQEEQRPPPFKHRLARNR